MDNLVPLPPVLANGDNADQHADGPPHAPHIQPIPVQLSPPKSIVVMGSSYIRHLDTHLLNNNVVNMHLDDRDYDVMIYGVSGMALFANQGHKKLSYHIKYINLVLPDILCLMVGSNDIMKHAPNAIASSLMGMAGYAKAAGVKSVYIMQLLPRKNKAFNIKLPLVNDAILSKINDEGDISVRFWRHKGLLYPQQNVFYTDNVHLNEYGNEKLFRSVRGCILRAVKLL